MPLKGKQSVVTRPRLICLKCFVAALQINSDLAVKFSPTTDNFPTDLYMVQGIEQWLGVNAVSLRLVSEDSLLNEINENTAVVLVYCEVNFRTTAVRLPMAHISATREAMWRVGPSWIWRIVQGALPVDVVANEIDFAVGCCHL